MAVRAFVVKETGDDKYHMFNETKYTKWYFSIVKNAKGRIQEKGLENHHIIPDCFFKERTRKGSKGWLDGNPEAVDNKVFLTAREHYVCHWLLTKMTIGLAQKKMIIAFAWVCTIPNGYIANSRTYARYKQIAIIAHVDLLRGREQTTEHVENRISKIRGIPRDPTIYSFFHKSGLVENSTRLALEKKYNLNKSSLLELVNGRLKTHAGWRITFEPQKFNGNQRGEKNPKFDHTTRTFIHGDGEVEICTQFDLRTKYKLNAGDLSEVISGKLRSCKGWRMERENS